MKPYLAVAGEVSSETSFTEKCVHGLYCLIKISVKLKPLVCFDLVSDANKQQSNLLQIFFLSFFSSFFLFDCVIG